MSNPIERGAYVYKPNLEALQSTFPAEPEPPKPVAADSAAHAAAEQSKAQESTPTLTARIKDMIVNASERHVGSLKLSDARAATAEIRKALKAELKATQTRTPRFAFLSKLSDDMGKNLDKLCRAAETSFAKLAKLKGSQIGSVGMVGKIVLEGDKYVYKLNPDCDPRQNPMLGEKNGKISEQVVKVAEILTSAMTAQKQLADHLENLHRKTGCAYDGLYEMAAASRARECEMNAMYVGLGVYKKAKATNDFKDVPKTFVDDASFGMTVSRLLGRFAAEMHGNDMTFDLLEHELKPIADDLETLKRRVASGKKDVVDMASFAALRKEIAEAVKVLRQASGNGIQVSGDGSRFILEASVMRAAEKHLNQLSADLTALETQAVEKAADGLAEDLVPDLGKLSVLTDGGLRFLDVAVGPVKSSARTQFEEALEVLADLSRKAKSVCRDRAAGKTASLKALLDEVKRHDGPMRTLVRFAGKLDKTVACLDPLTLPGSGADLALWNALREPENQALRDALLKAAREGAFASLEHLNPDTAVTNRNGVTVFEAKLALADKRLAAMQKMKGTDFAVDDPLLLGLFRGDYTAATYIGAKSWEMPPEMLNPSLDDGALVSSEPLGSGAANTVYLCTYRMPDGSEQKYVFKPELTARLGMDKLLAGYSSYTDDQKAASMNFAAKQLAAFLGTDTMMPNAYVGVHNGKFGLFMSVAPGVGGNELGSKIHGILKGVNSPSDFSEPLNNIVTLPMTTKGVKALGSLAKEVSALEWNDLLTGQADRHWGNYKVSYDKTGGKFSITGIDNDLSFPPWRLGVFKFRIRGHHVKRFADMLGKKVDLSKLAQGKTKDDVISLEDKFPGVKLIVNGENDYILDLTPPKNGTRLSESMEDFAAKLCLSVFGMQRMTVPTFVSAEMRAKMQKLKDMGAAQIKEMLKVDLTDDQIEAFRSRIKDALRYADILAEDSREIEDGDWGKVENGANTVLTKMREDFGEIKRQKLSPNSDRLRVLYGPLASDFFAVNKFYFA